MPETDEELTRNVSTNLVEHGAQERRRGRIEHGDPQAKRDSLTAKTSCGDSTLLTAPIGGMASGNPWKVIGPQHRPEPVVPLWLFQARSSSDAAPAPSLRLPLAARASGSHCLFSRCRRKGSSMKKIAMWALMVAVLVWRRSLGRPCASTDRPASRVRPSRRNGTW